MTTRRRALALGVLGVGLAAGGASAGCARPVGGGAVAAADVYVGLARARAVAVLDSVTDVVRGTLSLAALGDRGLPAQLGVGPAGAAVVLPMVSNASAGARVGLVAPEPGQQAAASAAPAPPAPRTSGTPGQPGGRGGVGSAGSRAPGVAPRWSERCTWLGIGSGNGSAQPSPGGPGYGAASYVEAAQNLAADARGRAFVLFGDASGMEASFCAVVDIADGRVLRRFQVAARGERVLALLARPDGERLYASVWLPPAADGRRSTGAGWLTAFDTRTGSIQAQAALPAGAAIGDLTAAGASFGVAGTLFAVVGAPGPFDPADDDGDWPASAQFSIAAFDATQLDLRGTWVLDRRPSALAVTPGGDRAYLLGGSYSGTWSRWLVSLDLGSGAQLHHWALPAGCMSLALTGTGKVYVADAFGDRLWRFDTRADALLGDMAMPGVPIAIAARPT